MKFSTPGSFPKFFRSAALLLGGALLLAPLAAAQSETGSLVGRVSPTHDHDMVLATASIPELGLEVAIAGDGTFRFDAVRPGSHILRVHVPTLGVAVERVEISSGEEAEVEVEIVPGSHFEEVVVSIGGRDALELANPVTSLGGSELQLRVEASLGETLSNEAGVSSSFFGPGASRPIIRGFSGDRVRMLENGIGTGDASDVSVDHAVTTDPSQAERIEIIRGPATLLYGSSAVGGVINVVDERIPTTRASQQVGGTVDLRGGSVSDERVGTVNLQGGAGEWAWSASAVARETDDYEIPGFANVEEDDHGDEEHGDDEHGEEHHDEDEHEEEENPFGMVPNTDLETQGGRFGVTRFFGDRGYLGVSVSGFDTDYGIPGGAHEHAHEEEGEEHHEGEEEHHDEEEGEHHDEDEGEHDHEEGEEEAETVRIDMEQRRVDLRGQLRVGDRFFQALKVRVGANDYEHTEFEGEEAGTRFFNESIETRIELVQQQRANGAGSIGIQYSDRDLEAIGAEAFLPKSQSERWAAFTFQEIAAGALTWQFGARFESQDADAVGVGSTSHDGISGSAGFVWEASDDWSVAASLSRSVKLPALEELFANGAHIATQSFEIGDPNLTEEVGTGLDLSLRKTRGRLTGELTLFRQDFSDFVFQAFTDDEEDGLPVVLFAQEDAEFQGAELTARYELFERDGHHLHLRVVGDVVDAELDAGGHLPRIPPLSLGAGLHYHSERWNAMAEVRWTDDQDDVATMETPTEGYTFVNASLGYRFLFGGQILDLMLRGRNLTDEEARVHTSFLKNFAPLPGRDVSLSARFWF